MSGGTRLASLQWLSTRRLRANEAKLYKIIGAAAAADETATALCPRGDAAKYAARRLNL
jgi:hypothetical protein